MPPAGSAPRPASDLDACGLAADDRGRLAVDPTTFQTERAAHLRRRRRHRLPEPRLDLDGAGPHRRLPRLRRCRCRRRPQYFPYGIYAVPEISTDRADRGGGARQAASPTSAASPASARPRAATSWALTAGMLKMIFSLDDRRLLGVHIVGEGATELIHIGQAVLNLGGTHRLFRREHLQLSDAGRSLQDRRARRLEPHAQAHRLRAHSGRGGLNEDRSGSGLTPRHSEQKGCGCRPDMMGGRVRPGHDEGEARTCGCDEAVASHPSLPPGGGRREASRPSAIRR